MIRTLRNAIRLPVHDDEELNRRARLLYPVLAGVCLVSLVPLAISVRNGAVGNAAALFFFVAVVIVAIWRVRRGLLTFARWGPAFAIMGISTYLIAAGNGIHDVALLVYPVIVVFTSLVAGKRAALVFAVLAIVSVGMLAHLEIVGVLQTAFSGETHYEDVFTVGSILAATGVITSVTMDGLTSSLEHVRANERVLAQRNTELQVRTDELRATQQEVEQLNLDLEAKVAERTRELEQAIRELEAFTSTVSHDLRAPLRAIDGFSRILIEEHFEEFSPEAQRLQLTVRRNTDQMMALIDSLLQFAWTSRRELRKQRVDPNAIVAELLADRRSLDAVDREVSVETLPSCDADPRLLKQVYANLLDNAFKFTTNTENARIEVGCRRDPTGDVYFVRDNGPGFDMAQAGELFTAFRRLHSEDEFEGTGIGLATVQRIVERHGGRVWAEAKQGGGATFSFTLSRGELAGSAG